MQDFLFLEFNKRKQITANGNIILKFKHKMKKITLLSIMAAMFAALSFTSCNTGDDNSYTPLTKEQQTAYQRSMAGSYSNMMLTYQKKNAADVNNQTDSVETYCQVSLYGDSTMTIANFPVAAMAEHISGNDDLKAAIAEQEPTTLRCKFVVQPQSTNTVAYIYACPEALTMNLTYGSTPAEHKVNLVFSYSPYTFGVCDWTNHKLGFQFYLAAIYVDGKKTDYLKNSVSGYASVPFLCQPKWEGKKN